MVKVLTIIGTRPEAIKVSMLHKLLLADDKFKPLLVSTGQHDSLLLDTLAEFDLKPDVKLEAMRHSSTLAHQHSYILRALQDVIDVHSPELIIVQGDTLSALCGAQIAFYNKIRCAHLEAGLRTHNKWSPFPEEINRRTIDLIADYHFCPTESAGENLKNENLDSKEVHVTGNTGVDALLCIKEKVCNQGYSVDRSLSELVEKVKTANQKLIVLTLHRREIHGHIYESILQEIEKIAAEENYKVIYPLHPNPQLKRSIDKLNIKNIHLINPLNYGQFLWLMMQSDLVITDSGGIQEEAPYLGINAIVLRNETERSEILNSTNYRVSDINSLAEDIHSLINASPEVSQPYGSGDASQKIIEVLKCSLD